MQVFDVIRDFAERKNILSGRPLPISSCTLIRPYKLQKIGCFKDISHLTVYMLAVPYLCEGEQKNISSYAVPRDYHVFFKELFSELTDILRAEFPENNFAGFSDDSPIAEVSAAACSGLGVIGLNSMLITPSHSSYVFLGEIFSDCEDSYTETGDIKKCIECGECLRACPKNEIGTCLSALTQKKGQLSEFEAEALARYSSAWGCDVCQAVCPYTKKAISDRSIYTDVPFFKEELIFSLSSDMIKEMDEPRFLERAYSWRGKNTILRNLEIIEKNSTERKSPNDSERKEGLC